MRGLFTYQAPIDMLGKLERDLKRIESNRVDIDAAMDFFVTAESLVDWVLPRRENTSEQKKLKNESVLLQVVSHIASGAKHFDVQDKQHTSVKETTKEKERFIHYSGLHYVGVHYENLHYGSPPHLVVILDGVAKEEFGNSISVLQLAEMVVEYWSSKLNNGKSV